MTNQQPESAAQSFARHVRAFHSGLPPEEQALLEQVFALAELAASGSGDAEGFLDGSSKDASFRSTSVGPDLSAALGTNLFGITKRVDRSSPL